MTSLKDARIVVTGATSGIGLAVASACLSEGARVTIVGRNREGCENAAALLGGGAAADPEALRMEVCDLSRPAEVERLAQRLSGAGPVDALVSNAGVQPWTRELTPEGIELTFATNVLAHFVLVEGLSEALANSRLRCVVATGSMVHRWGKIDWNALDNPEPFDSQKVYARSKTELLLLQTAFALRLASMGIGVHTLEPGMTRTNFARHFQGFDRFMARVWQIFMRDPGDVARDFVSLLKRDDLATTSTRYWYKGLPKTPASFATDPADAERLLDYCRSLAVRTSG